MTPEEVLNKALPELYPDCGEHYLESGTVGQWYRCPKEIQ